MTRTIPRSVRPRPSGRRTRPGVEALEARIPLSLGSEFVVSTTTVDNVDADNASSANGSAVAVWVRPDGPAGSGVTGPLQYRLYDAQGRATGLLRTIEAGRINGQPSVGMDASGNFVIAWTRTQANGDRNVLAARFNAAGNQVGAIVNVAIAGARAEYEPTVAVAANGAFAVAYAVQVTPTNADVEVRTFSPAGLLQRTVTVAATLFNEHAPSAAAAPDGRFVVAYQRDGLGTQPDVFLARYAANGNRTALVPVADSTRFEASPDVGLDNNANAVVTWYEISPTNAVGVFARRVPASGTIGRRLTIREASNSPSSFPSVAVHRTNGTFVVAYDLGFYSVNPQVLVTEVNANDTLRPTVSAGADRQATALSINASGRYFLTYAARPTRALRSDIRGRFGSLA